MGIGTLRRYHPTVDPALRQEALADDDAEVREHQAAVEAAVTALDAAREAAQTARTHANEHPDDLDAEEAAVAAETAAQDAQAELERIQTEFEDQKAREAIYADAPSRGAAKADWIAYAGRHGHPVEGLVDGDGKALGRDAIAEIFLGPKA